jgi:hypothetical protein
MESSILDNEVFILTVLINNFFCKIYVITYKRKAN